MKIKLIIAALIGALTGAAVTASKANKVIKEQHNALQQSAVILKTLIDYSDGLLTEEEANLRLVTDLQFLEMTKEL